MIYLIYALLFIGFVLVAVRVNRWMARPWNELAARFDGPAITPERRRFMCSGHLHVDGTTLTFRWILTVGVGKQGLVLTLLPPFGFAHDPIAVPWHKLAVLHERTGLFGMQTWNLGDHATLEVSRRVGRRMLLQASGGRVGAR